MSLRSMHDRGWGTISTGKVTSDEIRKEPHVEHRLSDPVPAEAQRGQEGAQRVSNRDEVNPLEDLADAPSKETVERIKDAVKEAAEKKENK